MFVLVVRCFLFSEFLYCSPYGTVGALSSVNTNCCRCRLAVCAASVSVDSWRYITSFVGGTAEDAVGLVLFVPLMLSGLNTFFPFLSVRGWPKSVT